MPLIFVRHPRPDAPAGLCYGRTDLALAPGHAEDAARLARDLPPLDRIVSSPLTRARHLAESIAAARDLVAETDDDLAEMDFGTWEGLPWDDIPRAEIDAWAADFLDARPHGGESVRMLRARVSRALARPRHGATLWVSHAGVYRAALDCLGTENAWDARIGFAETAILPG